MNTLRFVLCTIAAGLLAATSAHADQLLSGAISAKAGGALEGVTVSAKRDGSPITTSVYTDATGNYYFPPLPDGQYSVWANALGFEFAKSSVTLDAKRRQNFALAPMMDAEARYRQLPGELMVAGLPEATPEDAFMKKIFTNNCTACHTPSYVLQFRFDEAGWNKIIDLMKMVPNNGVYPGPQAKPNALIDRVQKQLAAYLARARGPGASSMTEASRPRPSGESARAVWTLYDLNLNPDSGIGTKMNPNDGANWSLGTTSKIGQVPHDGGLGLDGNVYFTANNPNKGVTIGKVDAKTGAVKYIKTANASGNAATAHGLVRDNDGNFWFDINTGRRGLGKLDVKTDAITVYQTPPDMSPLGGAVTMDVDGKGKIWASTPVGVVRFDPASERFTEFKSPATTTKGAIVTYGAAGDRDGNGWWAQMAVDVIGKGDVASGKTITVKLPALQSELDRLNPEDRAFFENFNGANFSIPVPWAQGPRRMGTDKNADVLWVGNSWGNTLARIDTKTLATSFVKFPDPTMQPYHIAVDTKHNVWGNLWTSDRIVKYDPANNRWTAFDLPVRGTEIRHIALLETDGKTQVVMPVYRTNQMGVMRERSEAEINALKAQAR